MTFTQLTKEQAKEEVKRLVDKYLRIVETGKLKSYNEEMTKKELIEPLFEALGWDIRNTITDDEVLVEEKISKGRVDYSFRIGGIPKFFLEAKSLKEDLDNPKFIQQAIDYSWHKSCTWAVLTDFEAVKIFNAEWKSLNPLQAQFLSMPCQLFLEKFDQLWLLSKESFEKKLLDAEAEKWGKKIKKIPVDKQLLTDLTRFRELLTKNILKINSSKNLSADELDEAVQRIIDRMIFIRTLEDKELEPKILEPLLRESGSKKVYTKLKAEFRRIDDVYNSKLFAFHLIDQDLNIDDEVLEKVITGLFKTSDDTVHYDFAAIDADVLGNIYEQYLGHILKKTEKRAKLAEGKAHRKEQGIYYTPTYVVDYIVKNTLGELAKDKKFDLAKIKVLDPACGSGSFLMKAFDYLVTLDKKKNGEVEQTKLDLTGASASYGRKVEILKNNIFGVDLDPKAVEIAQLNLLLKAAEKKHRLPTLQENIKVGNSLIDNPEIAGTRAFKWEEQFKNIIAEGGFDVVIGNPPYIRVQTANPIEKDYLSNKYLAAKGKYDIYALFIEKALTLLKDGGLFSFIIPNKFTQTKYGEALKKHILNNYTIEQFIDFGDLKVFEEATTYPCILVIRKEKPRKKFGKYVKIKKLMSEVLQIVSKKANTGFYDDENITCFNFKQQNLNKENWSFMPEELQDIYDKMRNSSNTKLSDLTDKNVQGFITGDNESFMFRSNNLPNIESGLLKKVPKGRNVQKYVILDDGLKVLYTNSRDKKPLSLSDLEKYPKTFNYLKAQSDQLKKRKFFGKQMSEFKEWWQLVHPIDFKYFENPKIITPNLSSENKFVLDEEGYFVEHDCYIITLKNNNLDDYKYAVALLNSKAVEFFFKQKSPMFSGGYYKYHTQYLNDIPIPHATNTVKTKIVEMVNSIVKLKKELLSKSDKQTDEKLRLENEIRKLDDEINQEVYKLYGLTKEEIQIIEESLK